MSEQIKDQMSIYDSRLEKLLGEPGSRLLEKYYEDDGNAIGNFNKVQIAADDIDARSDHFKVTVRNLGVYYEDEKLFLQDNGSGREIQFSEFGLNKFCQLVDVPSNYVKRCLATGKEDLAVKNMNSWLRESLPQDKEMLVRTTDDRFYAMLSHIYSMYDDHEVLAATNDILAPMEQYRVTNALVRPEYMKVRLVSREKVQIGNDELMFGFDVKNSRVGNGSLEVTVLMYRFMCANGMLFGGAQGFLYRKRHVGIQRDDFMNEFNTMLLDAPRSIEHIKFQAEKSMGKGLSADDIQNLLNAFRAESFASKNMAGQVEQMLNEKYTTTQWGFTNAITEVAQQYSYDVRESMEEFAGKLLNRVK